MSERVARAALSRLSEPGEPRLSGLVARLGAERVHALLLEEQDVAGVYTDVAERLRGLDPERELARAAERGIRFVCPGDDEWPGQVGTLEGAGTVNGRGGAPLGLWVRGPLRLDEATRSAVAVVGSRSATTYGADVAGRMGADLAAAGVTVVSGAAYGIDVAAHRGALAAKGPTVAVLACGVDRTYPAGNKAVLEYIAAHGLVVSELPPGCAPTRLRFLSRNRLIAALSAGTVVVEAAVRSGALSTANWASRTGRVLMGVPGPVTSAPSEGVHELMRTGEAVLVTRAEHVLELVSGAGEHLVAAPRAPERRRDRLTPVQQQVLDAVPVAAAAPARSVARTAGVSPALTEQSLVRLREAGLVEEAAAGWRLVRSVRLTSSGPGGT
jgi:DNA processing protein